MLSTRTRSLAALTAGALLLAPLTGCGDSDDEKKSGAKTSSSSTATPGADPTATGESGEEEEVKGEEIDPATFIKDVVDEMRSKKTAHMVIEMGSSMTADADIAYGDTTAMRMTMTTGAQTMKALMLDGAVYIQTPPSKKYIKIDKDTPGSEAVLGGFEGLNPAESVSALKGAIKRVVKVGRETVDGDELTRYALTVDTSAVSKQLGQPVAGADEPQLVTYSMYLDEDDLLRLVKMEISGQKVTMKVTDWGKKFVLKAPAASEIIKQ